MLILQSGVGVVSQGNIWLYGLYGGLAAGVFEETGRFLAFRFVLRNRTARITSLVYGIGHGGIEAFLVAGLTMASNLILGVTYTHGGAVPSDLIPAIEALLAIPAPTFLWSGFEGCRPWHCTWRSPCWYLLLCAQVGDDYLISGIYPSFP